MTGTGRPFGEFCPDRLHDGAIGNLAYTYDANSQITGKTGSMAITALPDPVSGTSFNAVNQVTGSGTQSLIYDASGNLISDGTNTYFWDARNHLSSISGGVSADFIYDVLKRRTSKSINNTTTQFLYDGINPVQELDGSNPPNATANLLTGLNFDERFQRSDASGALTYLSDALGSALALANTMGDVATSYTYDPFGNVLAGGSYNANSYQYAGRENDGTGLYFYRARYLSARLQRFISQDPIGFGGGQTNLYGFVGDNPVNYTDPSGLFLWWIHERITDIALDGDMSFPGLAQQVAAVDWTPSVSVSQDPANAYWHAMSDGETNQTPEEAEALFNSYVSQQIGSCTQEGLARALHAVQDSAAAGHKGFQPWCGGLPSAQHLREMLTQPLVN